MPVTFQSLARTVAPARDPVTLAEVKHQLNLRGIDEDDDLLDMYVKAATEYAEQATRRQLYTATWALKRDEFPSNPSDFVLPRPPLQSVSSITYVDGDGATQTVAASTYVVDTSREPGRVTLAHTKSWPTDVRAIENAVVVTYLAGWSSTASIPARIKIAIMQMVAHMYENREPFVLGQGFTVVSAPKSADNFLAENAVPEFY